MADDFDEIRGLDTDTADEWPKAPANSLEPTINRLKPGSDLHKNVLEYLLRRLSYSENAMRQFYSRWNVLEHKVQAYINLPDWEQRLKELNDSSGRPQPVPIVVPYTFSILSTICTFLTHVFLGKKPMLQVGTYDGNLIENARCMEIKLQYDGDHSRILKHLMRFFWDANHYGVAVLQTCWHKDIKTRSVRRQVTDPITGELFTTTSREPRTVYDGNMVRCVDPFMFFPDPRVPMSEVNRKGEYVFWRSFEGRHALLKMEAEGTLKWVQGVDLGRAPHDAVGMSRGFSAYGETEPHRADHGGGVASPFIQVDQGTLEIIPAELGLGDSETPEKWIFTIANKRQIIQADRYGYDHDMHPVVVTEPYTQGYGFGQPGMSDYITPLQDIISWLANSRVDNVRKVLNDMFVVDPNMIEMKDLRTPEPGKLIRLKRTAIGMDVRAAISQFSVVDVTAGHVADIDNLMKIGYQVGAVNSNVVGIMEDSASRKTATEVRTSSESAVSRLSALTRTVSAQAIVDLTEQMTVNNQQFVSDEFMMTLLGKQGQQTSMLMRPEMLVGDFYYPIHDGTMPIDRVAMVDVMKELLTLVLQSQGLSQVYDVIKLVDHTADLAGVRNIQSFKISPMGQQQLQAGVQAGNFAPLRPTGSGQTPGLNGPPARRMAGGY